MAESKCSLPFKFLQEGTLFRLRHESEQCRGGGL